MVRPVSLTASAPGSLMLLGEHAVLHGRRALVSSVHQRLSVTLSVRADRMVGIHSALGTHQTPLDELAPHPKFRFVLAALATTTPRLERGLDLHIASEFSDQIGFGSSAAVTVATVAVLQGIEDAYVHLDGWGYYGSAVTTARVIPVGTLVLDLVDASTKKLVWRGVVKDEIDTELYPEEREKKAIAVAKQLFAEYPPGGKK